MSSLGYSVILLCAHCEHGPPHESDDNLIRLVAGLLERILMLQICLRLESVPLGFQHLIKLRY